MGDVPRLSAHPRLFSRNEPCLTTRDTNIHYLGVNTHTRPRPSNATGAILCGAILLALTPVIAESQVPAESTLGDSLVHEYEQQRGVGSATELEGISKYISSVGTRVASALPAHPQYHFIFDPNPQFKSSFALPGRNIIVGGGLLAMAETEDELANALAHEIEHVELGQVSARVAELTKHKDIEDLHVRDFFGSYTKDEELACDLGGQKLAARAGYSPAGMLTLLQTFKSLRKGQPEPPSQEHPTLSERIAQAEPLANAATQKQIPLSIP
jgi:predicted Zn-dependent protease